MVRYLQCKHYLYEGWEWKSFKCFFTYIHLDLFQSHSSKCSTWLYIYRMWLEKTRAERRKKYNSDKPFNDLWIRMETPRYSCKKIFQLTLIPISNQKWLAFATSIESGQPAHLYSLNRLYTVGWPLSNSHLDILNIDTGHFQNWKFRKLAG